MLRWFAAKQNFKKRNINTVVNYIYLNKMYKYTMKSSSKGAVVVSLYFTRLIPPHVPCGTHKTLNLWHLSN